MTERITHQEYEDYLNEVSEDMSIVSCRERYGHIKSAVPGHLGTAIRKHDPILFEVGYNEYIAERNYRR